MRYSLILKAVLLLLALAILGKADYATAQEACSNAVPYRGQNGKQVTCTCPANFGAGSVWGTDVYTDDSYICGAAVHAGLITFASGGAVAIEIRPGQSSYTGSTRNGVSSAGYGNWYGSYVFVGTTQPPPKQGGMEHGIDRPGGDYKNFDLPDARPELCQSECAKDSSCAAWTYVNPGVQGDYPRCWLKSIVPTQVPNSCCTSGVKGTQPPQPPQQAATVPLKLYWSAARGDNFTTGTASGEGDAIANQYTYARTEGYVFPTQQPGTVPLKLYYNDQRGDNFTTATADGERDALAYGYRFARIEGYVYPTQQPGTVPLKLFYSNQREDNFSTATADGETSAYAAGYYFARIEGYVFPAGGTVPPPPPPPQPSQQTNRQPNAPTLISPANSYTPAISASPVTFQWRDNGDADGDALNFSIQIYIFDASTQQWSVVHDGPISGSSYTTNLASGSYFGWRVIAVDPAQRSTPAFTSSESFYFSTAGSAAAQPQTQNPWESTQGQVCIDRWVAYAMERLNGYSGSREFNARKPWSINKYGILEGNPQYGPASVSAPDDFPKYGNNRHWWIWDHYNPNTYTGWQVQEWNGAQVEGVQSYVNRCMAGG